MNSPPVYRGRFAPSPTGPLHFGSLVAAVGSYAQTRSQHGKWLLRIEDLDTERNQTGAVDNILQVLQGFGFEWDEAVCYQSDRIALYLDVIEQLRTNGHSYFCHCSRKSIKQAMNDTGYSVYPGICRSSKHAKSSGRVAVRLKVNSGPSEFIDGLQGLYYQNLKTDVGDFIIQRADGHIAYQLAVVVDDHLQGITQVVRGADLLDNTPRQIYLQKMLGYTPLSYVHLPVAVNNQGQKLSKQTRAQAIDVVQANPLLCQAADFLGHPVPPELQNETLSEIWQWLIDHWQLSRIPKTQLVQIDTSV